MSPLYEQIEAYLDGTLTPKELHDFEEALKSRSSFTGIRKWI